MKVVVHPDYAHLAQWVEELPNSFSTTGQLLYAGRNSVRRYQLGGVELAVKRYKFPHPIQRLVYTLFKPSKAARAYAFGATLRQRGIDTPHEVAYIETYRCRLFAVGYFVSLYTPLPSVCEALDPAAFEAKFGAENRTIAPLTADQQTQMRQQLAAFLVALHTKEVVHGDLNLSNILYQTHADGSYGFTLIDTNRTLFKRLTPKGCCVNLRRLTHQRQLLLALVADYATLRGWDVAAMQRQITIQLERLEQKEQTKKRFKRLIHP